jgi:hypothetical protein
MLNQYERYVIEEARHYMEKARKILEEGLLDPEKYYKESKDDYEKLVKIIPFLYLMNQGSSPPLPSNL